MIGGRPKGIGIIALQVSFAFNGFGFGHLGFMAGKPDALRNQIGNLLSFSGSGSIYDQGFRHGYPPNIFLGMSIRVVFTATAVSYFFLGSAILLSMPSAVQSGV
jgi:hypothetical protein